jgi:hypothetical protein
LTVINRPLFATLFIVFCCIVFENNSYALNGSFKTYLSELENHDQNSWNGSLSSSIRPKYTWNASDKYAFYIAYALTLDWKQSTPLLSTEQMKRDYRLIDLDQEISSSKKNDLSKISLIQNLDRFYMNYSFSNLNLNVGRAPIAFGSAKIINPTDVLTPISYQTLDKEERVGVDTVRMNYSLGTLSLIDVGYVVGDKFKVSKSAAFFRLKTNYLQTDISTMIMDFQDNLLIGIDLARSVGDASAWFESAYVIPKFFTNNDTTNLKNYFRSTLGIDYKLTPEIYSYVEYHYNGAGDSEARNYVFLQMKIPYTQGGVYLQGVHYLIPGLTYEINALWKTTCQFLLNLNDNSIFNNIALEYNVAQDMFLDLGAYLPFGTQSKLLEQKSEFGVYPKIIYSSFRFYF